MPLESLERLAESYAPDASSTRKRVLVVVNPYATTVSDRLRHLVVYALQSRYEVEAIDTQARDHATALAREAAHEGYDAVVSFGGDGTVNEVANGLAGSDTPLTCLPGGATNVLCKMLGIPGEIVDATEHLLRLADRWEPRRVDLASVNGRHFTFTSGFGLDASVVKRVDERPTLKTNLRQYYFAYAAVSTFLRHYLVRPPRMDVHVAGESHRGVTAIIQNGDPMTYFNTRPLHVAENVTLEDGTLGGVVLGRASPLDVPTVAFRMFVSRASVAGHRRVEAFSGVEELRCVSVDGRKIPLQVDGDHIGDFTEAVYAIRPAGLGVVS